MSHQNMCVGRMCKIAAIQLQCIDNIEHNITKIVTLVKQIEKTGAKMVFLPEGFDFIASSKEQSYNQADFLTGNVIQRMQSLARDTNMWLSLGGFHTKFYNGDKISEKMKNTHIIINSNGEIVSTYEKLNMFDLVGSFKESENYNSGVTLTPPVETPAGNLGLQICYDLRFPEFATMLRKLGADILSYPSAFTYETGCAHWEMLLKSRAVETQSYVVAANQTGWHNSKRRSFGHSMIIDPWGEVVAKCGEEVGFIVANIDHSLTSKVRNRMPCFETHRPSNFYPTSMCWNQMEINDDFVFGFGAVSINSEQMFLRTRLSVAFVNIRPVLPGHVLVSPLRKGVTRYNQLSFDELVDVNFTVQKVGDIVERHFCGSSLSVVVQDGVDAGQSIMHVHVHIIPRVPNDFVNNDMIYVELQNDDKQVKPLRSVEEMKNEALELRKYFY